MSTSVVPDSITPCETVPRTSVRSRFLPRAPITMSDARSRVAVTVMLRTISPYSLCTTSVRRGIPGGARMRFFVSSSRAAAASCVSDPPVITCRSRISSMPGISPMHSSTRSAWREKSVAIRTRLNMAAPHGCTRTTGMSVRGTVCSSPLIIVVRCRGAVLLPICRDK